MFLSAPMDVLGDVGERVRLGCSVSSNPLPTYTWTKDNLAEVIVVVVVVVVDRNKLQIISVVAVVAQVVVVPA